MDRRKHITFSKEFFIGINDERIKITDKYSVIRKLGKGGYGIVYEIQSLVTKERFACKVISKGKVNDDFEMEKQILMKADHPNIVRLHDIFVDPRFFYMVMDLCTGGELFDRIIEKIQKKQMYTEKEAAALFKQVLLAISYCHEKGIAHRDLKPENLLFLNKDENSSLKVIDFGLSKQYGMNSRMHKKVGTAYYVAPEVLKGDYDQKCDIWSAGVILYIILSGDPPFNGRNDKEIYDKIAKGTYSFPEKKWGKISYCAKDLIKKMLCPQKERLTADQCLEHEWFKMEDNQEYPLDINVNTFKKYVNSNKLKKAVITYVADRLNENEIVNLKNTFLALDKDNSGSISYEEFRTGLLQLYNIDESEIRRMFVETDTDASGYIDYTEFIASALDVKNNIRDVYLQDAFLHFDKNKNGKISKDELMEILKIEEGDLKAKELQSLIDQVDVDGDGEIDYNEFFRMMMHNE